MKIIINNLIKKFPKFTLFIDKMEIEQGIHVLIGPNGSGKTVFLKLLAGVLRPSKGSIIYYLNGKKIPASKILPYTALVLTDVSLPNWKVKDLIAAYLGINQNEAIKLAKEFRIDGFLDKRYEDLSSGYKKRIQLSIALSLPADIILLDEPFINVDSRYVSFLENKILEYRNRIVIVATHIPSRLLKYDIIAIQNGRILYKGKIPNLLENLVEIHTKEKTFSLFDLMRSCGTSGEVRIRSLLETVLKFSNNKENEITT